jgi:2-polyprenyl-3-methyl-5-hydroxy-6-metoxy-1,4-benzoquinol methylase
VSHELDASDADLTYFADSPHEIARLDSIAQDSWYSQGPNAPSARYCAEVFARFWRGSRRLELGPAEGIVTDRLAVDFADLTVVEGARAFCDSIQARHPQARVINSLFENFEPAGRFDTILLGHVLEHVESPRDLLRRAEHWLAPGGRLMAAVPNARSLHRQAAVLMGLLPEEHAFNEADLHHGHRRVYDPDSLAADFTSTGYRIVASGGYWLKPLSNAQIEASWSDEMLRAFLALGERYPDVAAEIYVVTER